MMGMMSRDPVAMQKAGKRKKKQKTVQRGMRSAAGLMKKKCGRYFEEVEIDS
jgi:hypothetical protein